MAVPPKNPMQYVPLGTSGLKVSRVILGCMPFGTKKWEEWIIEDQEEINKHIKFAYDSGIQTFDTANTYSAGRSEVVLGRAIRQLGLPREELVIMTKVCGAISKDPAVRLFGRRTEDYGVINQKGLSRKHIFDSVKASLERLQLDYIDVLQCHRFDESTPIEETMHALHDVVKAGLIRYIGMSSCWAWQFAMMQNYAIRNKLTPFISMQNHYNLVYREEEREMLPMLKRLGVACIPYSPLARGNLSRPVAKLKDTPRGKHDGWTGGYAGPVTEAVVNRVEEIATKRGIKMAQVAMAWVFSKPGVTAPVVGSTSIENLKEIIEAIDIRLTEEEIGYLEDAYGLRAVLGHR